MTIKDMVEQVKDEVTQPESFVGGSNLIEPTAEMVKSVIEKYLEGMSVWDIKVSVRNKDNKTLSEGQITEIINEYKISIAPVPEEPEEPEESEEIIEELTEE